MKDMDNANSVCVLLGGASDDRDLLSVKFMTMLMKCAMYDIQRLSRPPTPQEARGNEIISNLVSITKELTEKLEGRPHSAIIADNAEMLASSYVSKWLDGAGKAMVKAEIIADGAPTSVSLPLVQLFDELKLRTKSAAISHLSIDDDCVLASGQLVCRAVSICCNHCVEKQQLSWDAWVMQPIVS